MTDSLILRFTDKGAPEEGTMGAHARLIAEKGHVWYGKIGVPLAKQRLINLQEQDESLIYFVESGSGQLFKAELADSARELPDQSHIPSYYKERYADVKTWLKLTSLVECSREEIESYSISSSGMPALLTIRNSMSSFFYIRKDAQKNAPVLEDDALDQKKAKSLEGAIMSEWDDYDYFDAAFEELDISDEEWRGILKGL